MPVFQEARCAFVHVPKTAGTSVLFALRSVLGQERFARIGVWDEIGVDVDPASTIHRLRRNFLLTTLRDYSQQHLPATVLRKLVGAEQWNELFSFAFVRNPWDLVVSTYSYARANVAAMTDPNFDPDRQELVTRSDTFERFVEMYPGMRGDMSDMLCDENGELLVEFVWRFEDLERDFATLCKRLGVDVQLTIENASEHGPYRDYYTDRTRRIVERHFARDIERFGYEF